MTRIAFARDDILNADERAASARKCLALLAGKDVKSQRDWRSVDLKVFREESEKARSIRYAPTDPVVLWLRDMVSRYVT